MKKSLFQVSQDMQSLEELLFESDGDVTDEQTIVRGGLQNSKRRHLAHS